MNHIGTLFNSVATLCRCANTWRRTTRTSWLRRTTSARSSRSSRSLRSSRETETGTESGTERARGTESCRESERAREREHHLVLGLEFRDVSFKGWLKKPSICSWVASRVVRGGTIGSQNLGPRIPRRGTHSPLLSYTRNPTPPWRQLGDRLMVSLVNSRTNATRIG